MLCNTCHTENLPGSNFCESCGTGLRVTCPQCGHSASPDCRFCSSCGSSLASTTAERKHATVMFVDIVSSTEIISKLDCEQSLARVKPALVTMCAAVMHFDGTVVRSMGDGIMALFGAPRAQEGHALIACEAALAIQTEFSRNRLGMQVRIGLHSGDLLTGILDLDPTREADAHGLTVHIASRLQEIADPGGICLSEDCYRLVGPYCDVRSLGQQALKGVPEPIKTHSLRGLKPAVAS